MKRIPAILLVACLALSALGCVERKLVITSEPEGAQVYLDDQPVGQTPLDKRFDFYGTRTFTLRKDGYQTVTEVRDIKAPWHSVPVIDIITDLGPFRIRDTQQVHFEMTPVQEVDKDALIERAKEMRSRVTGEPYIAPKPAPPEATEPTPEAAPEEIPEAAPEAAPEAPPAENPNPQVPMTNQ